MIECVVYNPPGAGRCRAPRVGELLNGQAIEARLPDELFASLYSSSQLAVAEIGTSKAEELLKAAAENEARAAKNLAAKATARADPEPTEKARADPEPTEKDEET